MKKVFCGKAALGQEESTRDRKRAPETGKAAPGTGREHRGIRWTGRKERNRNVS